MSEFYYTEDHEWAKIEGDIVTIGISDYAQEQLGDIVFVEMPEISLDVEQGDEAGVIESVKTAVEIYAPVGGEVTEINEAIAGTPEIVNEDPLGDGWLFRMRASDAAEIQSLKSQEDYDEYVEGLE